LSFSSSRRRSSALPPRRANPCISILSLVFAVGVFHLLQDVRLSP
jgi:hypothetical protein